MGAGPRRRPPTALVDMCSDDIQSEWADRNLTLGADLGIGAGVIELGRLRALAAQKGLKAERQYWPRRVRLVCSNGAVLRFPTGAGDPQPSSMVAPGASSRGCPTPTDGA